MGDGLCSNLTIRLRADSCFQAYRRGCVGLQAVYEGTWSLDEAGVALTTLRAEALPDFEGPPSRLRVVADDGQLVALLEPDAVGWFGMVGLQGDCAFSRLESAEPTEPKGWADAVEVLRVQIRYAKETAIHR